MPLTKLVNGKRATLDPVEEQAKLNEWAAYSPPQPPTLRDMIKSKLKSDPVLRAQAIEMRDRLGLTNAQLLDLLESKSAEVIE